MARSVKPDNHSTALQDLCDKSARLKVTAHLDASRLHSCPQSIESTLRMRSLCVSSVAPKPVICMFILPNYLS